MAALVGNAVKRTFVALLAVSSTWVGLAPGAAAGGTAKAPRVEAVAVDAVVKLGAGAPAAIVHALDAGRPLRHIVRSIDADTLVAPPAAAPTTTTSAPGSSTGDVVNPVVRIDDDGIEPQRVVVDPSAPLIVANAGTETHVVEIKGTDLEKYSLEPDRVGVYELEHLAPGSFTLRCIVAGHTERAVLTIPDATSARFGEPGGATNVTVSALAAGARSRQALSEDDYVDRMFMFAAIVSAMAAGGDEELDAARMRATAARAQHKLEAGSADEPAAKETTADPRRVVRQAERHGVDPEMTLLTNAILLAARNGYDAGQITGFLLDDALDPKIWDTGQGLLRVRDAFVLGGVIPGVKPNDPGSPDVFRADAPTVEKKPTTDDATETDADVAGHYEGEFVGSLLEQLLAAIPGGGRPISNRVDITIDDRGEMRFTLELVVPAAWVSRDDTITCRTRHDLFAAVTPRPTAQLQDDGSFESLPFVASIRQTDFTGPECASHPYTGENDQDIAGLVLTGSVDGNTLRGSIPFEEAGVSVELEFRATR